MNEDRRSFDETWNSSDEQNPFSVLIKTNDSEKAGVKSFIWTSRDSKMPNSYLMFNGPLLIHVGNEETILSFLLSASRSAYLLRIVAERHNRRTSFSQSSRLLFLQNQQFPLNNLLFSREEKLVAQQRSIVDRR